jgi:hypothetical protein
MKIVVGALAVSLAVAGVAEAQDPGGVVVEFGADAGGGGPAQVDIEQEVSAFLAGRSPAWQEGWNDNRRFLVIVGRAALMCGPQNPSAFDQCRRAAFTQAMLNAKGQLVEKLSAEVSTAAILVQVMETGEGAGAADPVLQQAAALVRAEAERNGGGEQAVAQTVGMQGLRDAVLVQARAEASSLTAFKTFESIGADGKGDIAVICVFSKQTSQLRDALAGRGEPPTRAPGVAIGDWARSLGAEGLLYAFGTQTRTNENGELVLIGFGQASVASSAGPARDVARRQARLFAQQAMRNFMGEVVATAAMNDAETIQAYADEASVVKSAERFETATTSRAEALTMPGMTTAFSWRGRHPLSSRDIEGVVMVMSVSEALEANKLRKQFQEQGGSAGGRGIADRQPSAQGGAGGGARPPAGGRGGSGVGPTGEDP